jgi:hypothetical protein
LKPRIDDDRTPHFTATARLAVLTLIAGAVSLRLAIAVDRADP